MKKSLSILFLVLICISGIVACLYYSYNYLIIQGGPSVKTLTINNCTVNYTHFITDNGYQMEKSHGHAVNNIMALGGAKIELAKCLCDSYLNKKNIPDSTELVKILHSEEYAYAKKMFWSKLEDFNADTIRIEKVCNEREKYFGKMIMD